MIVQEREAPSMNPVFIEFGNVGKIHDQAEVRRDRKIKWMHFKSELFCKSQGHMISLSSLVRPESWMSVSPERTRIVGLLELRTVKMGFERSLLFMILKSTKLTTHLLI